MRINDMIYNINHLHISLKYFLSPCLVNHVYGVYQNPDHIQSNLLTRSHHQQSEKVSQKAWQKCNDSWQLDCMRSLQAITLCLTKHNAKCDRVCVCVHAGGTTTVQHLQAAIASVLPRFVRLMPSELYLLSSHKHLLYFPIFINFKWIKDKSSSFMGCNEVTMGVQLPMF